MDVSTVRLTGNPDKETISTHPTFLLTCAYNTTCITKSLSTLNPQMWPKLYLKICLRIFMDKYRSMKKIEITKSGVQGL